MLCSGMIAQESFLLADDDFFVVLELWEKLEAWTAPASTWKATRRRQVYEQRIYDPLIGEE